MAAQRKPRTARVKTMAPPRPQTLSGTPELSRRRVNFPPRFTFELGTCIGDDFTVIGHLSAGRISELYQ